MDQRHPIAALVRLHRSGIAAELFEAGTPAPVDKRRDLQPEIELVCDEGRSADAIIAQSHSRPMQDRVSFEY